MRSRMSSSVSPSMVDKRGDRKVPFRPVDHGVGQHLAPRLLEHPFAAVGELELGRAGGRQLDELVVEGTGSAPPAPTPWSCCPPA